MNYAKVYCVCILVETNLVCINVMGILILVMRWILEYIVYEYEYIHKEDIKVLCIG